MPQNGDLLLKTCGNDYLRGEFIMAPFYPCNSPEHALSRRQFLAGAAVGPGALGFADMIQPAAARQLQRMQKSFMIRLFFAVFGLGFLAMAGCAGDEKSDEMKEFQGLWGIVRMNAGEGGSGSIPKRDLARMAVEIKGNTLIWHEKVDLPREGLKHRGTIVIDPTKKPKTIDWIMVLQLDEPGKEKLVEKKATMLGIYSFEGNQLKLCLSNPLEEKPVRPKQFQSDRGSMLMILEKAK